MISARAIPGNEKAIGRVMNHIARRGVDVITESTKHVHVSGHGSEEELKLLLALVRPRYFIPIHGEYRQLARHARVAELVTRGLPTPVDVITAENGDVLRFDHEGGAHRRQGADRPRAHRRHARRRSRRRSAARSAPSGGGRPGGAGRRHQPADRRGRYAPEIIARGFVTDGESDALLAEGARLIPVVIAEASVEERTDPGLMQEKIRVELRRFVRKRTGRRPMVLPVVMEI